MSRWKHWCPKCGRKQVIYMGNGRMTTGKPVYECCICNSKFTKKEIKKFEG